MAVDEFALVLSELRRADDAATVAGRIVECLSQPYLLNSHEVFTTISVGISVYPRDGKDAESLLAKDVEGAVRTLYELKRLGVHISIDDFGTGYSSLNYLKRFPVDRLKIDRSFVKDILSSPDDDAIVSAVIGMAASLRLGVVAEGVETEAQLDVLRRKNCEEIQGYYLSRPIPAEELPGLCCKESVVGL